MKYNPDVHDRRSIRLRGWNYANVGAYFVTACLNQRIPPIQSRAVGAHLCVRPVAHGNHGAEITQTHDVGQPCHDLGRMRADNVGQSNNNAGQTHRSAPTMPMRAPMPNFGFPTFGMVENGVMILNDCGKMVEKYILEIENNMDKFSNVKIDEYIVMPDHIHAIIKINAKNDCPKLGTIVQWLKTMTTNEYVNNVKSANWPPFNKKLWQRNFYEHIIRDEQAYRNISRYIRNNPANWACDGFY